MPLFWRHKKTSTPFHHSSLILFSSIGKTNLKRFFLTIPTKLKRYLIQVNWEPTPHLQESSVNNFPPSFIFPPFSVYLSTSKSPKYSPSPPPPPHNPSSLSAQPLSPNSPPSHYFTTLSLASTLGCELQLCNRDVECEAY